MKISVVIPAYNAAATIEATLNSVLAQTVSPHEILVCDDGSTDNTSIILESFKPRVRVYRQTNQGVACARNYLCKQAEGDVIAFLDADDIWHPCYLELQRRLIEDHPGAAAYFTEHENFRGYGKYQWRKDPVNLSVKPEFINTDVFLKRYDTAPLSFQMSCCCVRKELLMKLGKEPFPVNISGADDTYFHNMLPLFGPVVHAPLSLVVYRIIDSSISANRLKMSLLVMGAFELLEERYRTNNNFVLYKIFKLVEASRKRNCGKYLMGTGRAPEAKKQFWDSIKITGNFISRIKSFGLFLLACLPRFLQPRWPSSHRLFEDQNSGAGRQAA
jgi:glycosyltransferase involved in cell wall biosynthesis